MGWKEWKFSDFLKILINQNLLLILDICVHVGAAFDAYALVYIKLYVYGLNELHFPHSGFRDN